mgnify:CR=1 FL=1
MTDGKHTVEYELKGEVARIYLNRPHRLNAVIPQLVEELVFALDRAERDQAKAAILSGRGRAFCSGHDLKFNQKEETESEKRARLQKVQDITRKIRQAPFPYIAAVHGYALGAGCEFALCCDLVIAEKNAKFGFPEVGVGLSVTGGISHILPKAVGLVKSKELLFLGEKIAASEAKQLGLINFVVDSDELETASLELANRLASLSQPALSRAKFILNNGSQMSMESALEMEIEHVLSTTSSEEALKAAEDFRAKK